MLSNFSVQTLERNENCLFVLFGFSVKTWKNTFKTKLLEVRKSQKQFHWNFIAQKMTKIFLKDFRG